MRISDWSSDVCSSDLLTGGAVDYWTPDAANVGAAGQTLNGLVSTLVPLAVGAGNPIPLLGTVALDTPTELLNQGAPLGAALGVGGIDRKSTRLNSRH